MFIFRPVTFSQCREEYIAYTGGLRLVDTYWENVILAADLFQISLDGKVVGYCSVCNRKEWEEYRYLTSFFLLSGHSGAARWLKPAIEALLREFKPVGALAVTGDETFLSLCMDYCREAKPYAYFFDYVGPAQGQAAPPAYPLRMVLPATESDLPDLLESGFYHDLELHNSEN